MQWVLSSKEINFPYPLGLTLLHMVFSSVLCFLLTKVFKVRRSLIIMIIIKSKIPVVLLNLFVILQILKIEEGMTVEM